MSDNIISNIEMCRREGASLQAGMNFGLGKTHSVILMSLRRNAERDGHRKVFKFRLEALQEEEDAPSHSYGQVARRRLIPTAVKLEVWKRDGGKCVQCGASDELHFDHDVPYSLGGTSFTSSNVQLLCARHNLAKRDRIA